MAGRNDRTSVARWQARTIRHELGAEIRTARTNAGLSLRSAGAAASMSHAQLGRIERAELTELTLDQACRAVAAVGLRLAVRAYPDGDPVADRAHRALLERFRQRLPVDSRWATEVPLPIRGDRRAWDGVAAVAGDRFAVEAETRLRDVQALDRRIALKQRDGAIDIVILVVSDTAANRRALAAHRDALRARFPLDGRAIHRALRTGRAPVASGVVVL